LYGARNVIITLSSINESQETAQKFNHELKSAANKRRDPSCDWDLARDRPCKETLSQLQDTLQDGGTWRRLDWSLTSGAFLRHAVSIRCPSSMQRLPELTSTWIVL